MEKYKPIIRVRTIIKEPSEHITEVNKAVKIARDLINNYNQENFGVILLNNQLNLIGAYINNIGTSTSSLVDIKHLLRTVILTNATQIIIFHNHPSNSTEPSEEDIQTTMKIKELCKHLDACLIDHISHYYKRI